MDRMPKIISSVLISMCLICGVFMLYFGISGTVKLNGSSKNYVAVTGYLSGYNLSSTGGYDADINKTTSDTYSLVYSYTVDGWEYYVQTDYATSFVPQIGSEKEIRYNPDNPEEAIIVGTNSNNVLIFAGALFTVVPLFIIFGILASERRSLRISAKMVETAIGIIFSAAGYGAMCIITGKRSIKGFYEFFHSSFKLPLLIPVVLILIGIYMLIKALFLEKGAEQ